MTSLRAEQGIDPATIARLEPYLAVFETDLFFIKLRLTCFWPEDASGIDALVGQVPDVSDFQSGASTSSLRGKRSWALGGPMQIPTPMNQAQNGPEMSRDQVNSECVARWEGAERVHDNAVSCKRKLEWTLPTVCGWVFHAVSVFHTLRFASCSLSLHLDSISPLTERSDSGKASEQAALQCDGKVGLKWKRNIAARETSITSIFPWACPSQFPARTSKVPNRFHMIAIFIMSKLFSMCSINL